MTCDIRGAGGKTTSDEATEECKVDVWVDKQVSCDSGATWNDVGFHDDEVDTLLNPTLIVEVLSPSTEDYDHGTKFAHYRSVPSLQVYLLVAQDRVHVELYERQPDNRWVLSETRDSEETLDLPAVGAKLALADVYDRVPEI